MEIDDDNAVGAIRPDRRWKSMMPVNDHPP
jgi:hypothetical protein